MGTYHARCLSAVEDAELIGIYDLEAQRAESLAKETGSRAFGDLTELLEQVDAVVIASDTQTHFDIGMQAVGQGCHLFMEKPITATVEQGRELMTAVRERGLKIQVGHVERYSRAFRSLKGQTFSPKFIETHRLSQFNPRGTDVAVILDLMIHDLDIILRLVDADIHSLDASGLAIVSDTVDIANARLTFSNGCVANVTASRISQNKMRKMRIFSEDSYISLDFNTGKTEVFRLADPVEAKSAPTTLALGEIEKGKRKLKILFETPEAEDANAIELELRDFVHSVLNDQPETVSGEQGLKALELAIQITDAIESQSQQFQR